MKPTSTQYSSTMKKSSKAHTSACYFAHRLRGEKSRFQLFGDTMNSASRMESTSVRGKIQLSTDTADLLIECGKAHWIEPREDLIDVKGKGTMQTYWVRPGNKEGAGAINLEENVVENSIHRDQEAKERLIDWNLTAMIPLLERIVAGRGKMRRGSKSDRMDTNLRPDTWNVKDEVQEVIQLAHFDSQAVIRSENGAVISAVVRSELRDYIAQISSLYLNNPFHNFSHAVCWLRLEVFVMPISSKLNTFLYFL